MALHERVACQMGIMAQNPNSPLHALLGGVLR